MRVLAGGSVALTLVACAATHGAPAVDFQSGSYTFTGSAVALHRYAAGIRRETVPVSGTLELSDSTYTVSSTQGNCHGQRRPPERRGRSESVACPEIRFTLRGANSARASAQVLMREIREVRSECVFWSTTATGALRCAMHDYVQYERPVWRSVNALMFARAQPRSR